MLYLSTGVPVVWLRYAEWLLTCPVLLIHLSNLTGLNNDYSLRTMGLLVSDVGCIVWGATAAMSQGYVRLIFFLIACVYGGYTFFHAAKVYIEAYHIVPQGQCRKLVIAMAWVYFLSWTMFPVLFAVGPEGFGHVSLYGSAIGHCILDLISKNVWGIIGNQLRVQIFQHIKLYGDIRKKQTIMIAGQEVEIETLVEQDDDGRAGGGSGKDGAGPTSFLVVKVRSRASTDLSAVAQMEIPTIPVGGVRRASTEMSMKIPRVSFGGPAAASGKPAVGVDLGKAIRRMSLGGAASARVSSSEVASVSKVVPRISLSAAAGADALAPGRVLLVVPDASMVEVFEEHFAQLPVRYDVDPALSADDAVQLVQQAAARSAVYDFVLMHPDFLRDCGPVGLLPRLRSLSQRMAAFGWSPKGPTRDLIEDSPLDGWLEGPSYGRVIKQTALVELVRRMQEAKQQAGQISVSRGTGDGVSVLLPSTGIGGGGGGSGNQVHPFIGGGLVPVNSTNDGSPSQDPGVGVGGGNSLRPTGTGTGTGASGGSGILMGGGMLVPVGSGGNSSIRITRGGLPGRGGTGTGTGSMRATGQGSLLTPTGSGPSSNNWMSALADGGTGSMRATGGGGGGSAASSPGSGKTASNPLLGSTGSGDGGVFGGAGSGLLANAGSACLQQQTADGDVDEVDALTSLSAPDLQLSQTTSPRTAVRRLSNNPLFVTPPSPRSSMSRLGSLTPRGASSLQPPPPPPAATATATAAAPSQMTEVVACTAETLE